MTPDIDPAETALSEFKENSDRAKIALNLVYAELKTATERALKLATALCEIRQLESAVRIHLQDAARTISHLAA